MTGALVVKRLMRENIFALNMFFCVILDLRKIFLGKGVELTPRFTISFQTCDKIFREKMSTLESNFPFMAVTAFELSQ